MTGLFCFAEEALRVAILLLFVSFQVPGRTDRRHSTDSPRAHRLHYRSLYVCQSGLNNMYPFKQQAKENKVVWIMPFLSIRHAMMVLNFILFDILLCFFLGTNIFVGIFILFTNPKGQLITVTVMKLCSVIYTYFVFLS